jgi:hypothetical protein
VCDFKHRQEAGTSGHKLAQAGTSWHKLAQADTLAKGPVAMFPFDNLLSLFVPCFFFPLPEHMLTSPFSFPFTLPVDFVVLVD